MKAYLAKFKCKDTGNISRELFLLGDGDDPDKVIHYRGGNGNRVVGSHLMDFDHIEQVNITSKSVRDVAWEYLDNNIHLSSENIGKVVNSIQRGVNKGSKEAMQNQ